MVAAVTSSAPTGAPLQEPQLLEKKTEGENGHHFGGLPSAEKSNTGLRKLRNREITSRYKAATVVPTPPVAPPPAVGRRNPSPLRQPSPSRQSSPVRNRSSSVMTVTTSEAPLRHPSPTLGRSINAPDVPKRALSAERRRPWPAITSDEKAASTSSAEVALASVKPRPRSGRGPELWPSMSASKQTESNGIPTNVGRLEGRDKESSQPSDHTLKPAANGAHRPTDRSADPAVRSPQRKGSPVRRQSIDQVENARPATNLHLKPDQQRWPGISNGKVFGGVMTRSVDLNTESVSSGGSGPGCRGPGRGTTVPARVWQDTSNRLRRFSEGDRTRSLESDLAAAGAQGLKAVRRSRVVPIGSQQSPTSTESMSGNMTSGWSLSTGRVMSNPGSIPQLSLSPQQTKGSSSLLRGLPSPQRTRPVSGTMSISGTARNLGGMIMNFGFDGRSRGKKALTQQEEAQVLRIFHNRWLQWRFVNARAEAVMSAQKSAAERSLYNVWIKTSELRRSVAMQRIKLQQARQAHKLHSILSTHAAHLENWEALEEEHSSALSGAMEALEAAILRVPVTGGAKADVNAVGEALGSAVDVLNAVDLSVTSLSPKAENMDMLLSQLAKTAAQERALLEECGDLLSVATSLEVEERSLRTQLIQLESEKGRASATWP
ncbi:unnamed protein product [Sphagnum balticum]